MRDALRRYGPPVLAVVLMGVGTLATGLLPPTPAYQAVAGAIIVLGFLLFYLSLDAVDL